MNAVWARTANDVWFGGDRTLLHWDGAQWSRSDFDGLAGSLWGDATDDFWAADDSGILHWDGQSWNRSLTHPDVEQVSGSGPKDVWATASDALWHWDGTNWSTVTIASLQSIPRWVWVNGPNDVWAFSGAQAAQWNGSAWTEHDPGFTVNLANVYEYGPNGDYQQDQIVPATVDFVGGPPGTVCVIVTGGNVGCYSGGQWVSVASRSEWHGESNSDGPSALGAVASPNIWTASYVIEGDIEPDRRSYTIDVGDSRHLQSSDDYSPIVTAISGASESDVWVTLRQWYFGPPILHTDGQQIGSPIPSMPGAATSIWDDGCGHVWAISSGHQKLFDRENTIQRRDSGGWTTETAGLNSECCSAPVTLGGASGAAPWAVGTAGYLAHRINGTWQVLPTGIMDDLYNPWTTASDKLWAAVANGAGTVVFWDGTQSHVYTLPNLTPGFQYAVPVLTGSDSSSDVWALAPTRSSNISPILSHFDGAAWREMPTPPGSRIEIIWTNSANELWAVDDSGAGAILWHLASGVWSPVLTADAGTRLTALTGRGSTDLWAAASLGMNATTSKLFHFDGRRWTSTPISLPVIDAVQPSSTGQLWILSGGRLLLLQP